MKKDKIGFCIEFRNTIFTFSHQESSMLSFSDTKKFSTKTIFLFCV